MNSPIITKITDQDLYKFCMQQVVLHQFPSAQVEYKFQDRGKVGLGFLASRIREEINALADIRATKVELEYMRSLNFLKSDYVDFLRIFRFFPEEHVKVQDVNGSLEIRVKGPWLHTILYEVKILAIVNECYFEWYAQEHGLNLKDLHAEGEKRLFEKIKMVEELPKAQGYCPFLFSNFGTRRRFSQKWAATVDWILATKLKGKGFVGTSNVYNAMNNGVKPIGTMAHEFLQAMQALTRLAESQDLALDAWSKEYRGNLGIALTDCLGLEYFLKRFDLYYAKLFEGLRHDSGDPNWWTERCIQRYSELGIDPKTKTAVYSDGLNVPNAIELWKTWGSTINTAFGIGTNLTNDLGPEALKIVLKMVKCNGQDVAKVADDSGKGMCENEDFVQYLMSVIRK